jgi:uncharacterized protein
MSLLDQLIGRLSPAFALRRGIRLLDQGKPREAFPLLSRAAHAGIPEGAYRVGCCYMTQTGIPGSRPATLQWLMRAANSGHVEAQTLLAKLYVSGHLPANSAPGTLPEAAVFDFAPATLVPDFVAAAHWARRASEAGSAEAQSTLGAILSAGPEELRDLVEAKRWYEKSAAGGFGPGHFGYASMLVREADAKARASPESDLSEARAEIALHIRRAAESGVAMATFEYGMLLEHGRGVAADQAAAMRFFRLAADRGHPAAQFRLGFALMQGTGVARDLLEAETWLRKAALAGHADSAALVGDLYATPGLYPPNFAEAAGWYRRAASAGHAAAARALGKMHQDGVGVPPDREEAAHWLRVAGEAGDKDAREQLARQVLRGEASGEHAEATRAWFRAAAESGDHVAAYNYAVCLADGVGGPRDDAAAAGWMKQAMDTVVAARHIYARWLLEGRGVERDPVQARELLARAAEAGSLEAATLLGDLMLNGIGGPKDPHGALACYEPAAKQNYVGAMFATAALLGGGNGIEPDRTAALGWYRRAAEAGHARAQLMLARYLAGGVGGEPDIAAARDWLRRAADQGVEEAVTELAGMDTNAVS